MRIQGAGSRRRRRTPEVAQAEIIAAAEAFLRERPFRELTVDEVMRRTELSRPSFYVYFKDRHELVLRVVEHLQAALLSPTTAWFENSGPDALVEGLAGALRVYAEHGQVMRALADAAADDPGVEKAYSSLIQTFVDSVAEHIASEIERGIVTPLDPEHAATALTWMSERYCYLTLSHDPTEANIAVVHETLKTIWCRTLYGVE